VLKEELEELNIEMERVVREHPETYDGG